MIDSDLIATEDFGNLYLELEFFGRHACLRHLSLSAVVVGLRLASRGIGILMTESICFSVCMYLALCVLGMCA